jgi:hypothetical protein
MNKNFSLLLKFNATPIVLETKNEFVFSGTTPVAKTAKSGTSLRITGTFLNIGPQISGIIIYDETALPAEQLKI